MSNNSDNNTLDNTPHVLASAKRQYTVTKKDLPLCCPMPDMIVWNSHPRVYLPIEKTGTAECPYCSAIYILEDNE